MGYSFAFLGLAYLIRAVGDVSSEALAWFSPLGWILRAEVYVNNYWWPIILTVGASLVLVVFALYLNSIRDLGAGFIPAKPGRKTASSFLQSPLGLSLRLQRTAIMGWLFSMFMLGASYGSIFGDVETYGVRFHMLDENPKFELKAPTPDEPKSIWFNILVPDIKETFSKAVSAGCTEVQPVTELPDYGVSNAIFSDPFGYQ